MSENTDDTTDDNSFIFSIFVKNHYYDKINQKRKKHLL